MRHISKRAFDMSGLMTSIEKTLFRPTDGPWENWFRLLPNIVTFFGPLGWAIWTISQVLEALNWGLSDLGAAIDKAYGFAPGTSLTEAFVSGAWGYAENVMMQRAMSIGLIQASNSNAHIIKNAFLGLIGKSAIKKVFKIFAASLGALFLALGTNKITEVFGIGVDDKMQVQEKGNVFSPVVKEEPHMLLQTPEETKEEAERVLGPNRYL